MKKIYNELLSDPYIQKYVETRIKLYEYPENLEGGKPSIILDPLDVPIPTDFGDDTWLKEEYFFQLDVWGSDHDIVKALAEHSRDILWEFGFIQSSGIDEWDKDLGIYRDARRYRGFPYRKEII